MRWMIVPYGESKSGVIFKKGRRRFHQMLVGEDVSAERLPRLCLGYPKPIRGHYFRGRERNVETQRKEENDHEQRFLKETVN